MFLPQFTYHIYKGVKLSLLFLILITIGCENGNEYNQRPDSETEPTDTESLIPPGVVEEELTDPRPIPPTQEDEEQRNSNSEPQKVIG